METIAVASLVVLAVAIAVVARSVWRALRGNDEPVAAGSFGRQFLGRRDRATRPEDWLGR